MNIVKFKPYQFSFELWGAGSLTNLNVFTRTESIKENKHIIRKYAIGYIEGENLWVRPKINTIAVMFIFEDTIFWTHMTKNEFKICFPNIMT